MIRYFLLAVAAALLPWAAQASGDSLAAWGMGALENRVVQSVTQDFNGDGKPDMAALVREDDSPTGQDEATDDEEATGDHHYALKILLGDVPKAVIDRADFWNPGQARFSGRADLPKEDSLTLEAPKPGMLWLRATGSGDDAMHLLAKFRWEKGRFRLIGEEATARMASSIWAPVEGKHCWEQVSGRISRTLSINYLTGKAMASDAANSGFATSGDGTTASDIETIRRVPYKIASAAPIYLDTYRPDHAPVFQEPYWNQSEPKPTKAKACPK